MAVVGRKSTDITDESWRFMCVAVNIIRGSRVRRWNGRCAMCRWLGFAVMIEKSYLSGGDTCILTDTWKAIWLTYRSIVFKKLLRYVQLKSTLGIYYIFMHIQISLWTFGEFCVQLDLILKHLYEPKVEFIICGDFIVNFLIDSRSAE